MPNPYLDYLTDPSVHGVNRLFVLLFEITADRKIPTKYHIPTLEIKDYNVMIDGQNSFDQPVKSYLRIYDNTRKIAIVQGDNYTTSYYIIIILM